jgi:hypothetical protein|eukprot:7391778-Prymnesium_polylepis.3
MRGHSPPLTDTDCARVTGYELNGQKHTNCHNAWLDPGGCTRRCNYNVFGTDPEAAFDNLQNSRKHFLSFGKDGLGCKGRRQYVYDRLTVPSAPGGQSLTEYTSDVAFQIANRRVCKPIFNLAYPVSEATLNRLVAMRRGGIGPNDADRPTNESMGRGAKSLYVIAWWRRYAETTAERLPDVPGLMTPRRHLVPTLVSRMPPIQRRSAE